LPRQEQLPWANHVDLSLAIGYQLLAINSFGEELILEPIFLTPRRQGAKILKSWLNP
jgi:hypothetical protein